MHEADFEKQKQSTLSKRDKSKKGCVDEEIKPLIDLINSNHNFYTTSSCSGRIALIAKKSEKKIDAEWLFISHNPIAIKDIEGSLTNLPSEQVWFKQESCIIHACARTLEDANKLVYIAKLCGFKRSCITSAGKRILVEVSSTESIETIIADNGTLLITKEYLNKLVEEANKKMYKNKTKIEKLFDRLRC